MSERDERGLYMLKCVLTNINGVKERMKTVSDEEFLADLQKELDLYIEQKEAIEALLIETNDQ